MATRSVGDADLGAKNECCALIEHGAGEAERCHQVLRWMLDEHPYWCASYRCFTTMPTEGYPQGGEFVGRVSPRSKTRRCKEHKV
jgi:hypothetical protein